MKKLFIIGGMGAGKSTARKALVDEGLPYIDLDKVGHQVLGWDIVKEELREEFGDDVFDENGEVVRKALAAKAFTTPASTRALNRITVPRIEDVIAILAKFETRVERAVASGWEEDDVRRRMARQITDAERIEESDVVFNNDGTPDELRNQVVLWWHDYKANGYKLA